MYDWMFDAETAEPPSVVPEYLTERQNENDARLIPPYVPVDGASGIAAPQICY
jgi:hypothetical protein